MKLPTHPRAHLPRWVALALLALTLLGSASAAQRGRWASG